jgi:uroporphyrinogen decarboxylase
MNSRERFLNCLNYQPVDHVPDMEFGAWEENFPVWQAQGMPKWVESNHEFDGFFGLETAWPESPPMFINTWPSFEVVVLEETERTKIVRQRDGVVEEVSKTGESMPRFVDFPVKDWDTWKRYKEEHFNIHYPGRWETTDAEWRQLARRLDAADTPVSINCGGFYGFARDLMGLENLSMAFALEPDLVEDIMETRTLMVLKAMAIAFQYCKVDFGYWWEDMCFNNGPFISPEMFKEFMMPRYRRITDVLKRHGVTLNVLDSDGNVNALAPLWLEVGINCLFPLEVRAGTDPARLRGQYGKALRFKGGVDKTQLVSEDLIEKELDRITPLVEDGGYIPHVDHRVPPDVSYANYRYYLKRKRERFGIPQPAPAGPPRESPAT